MVACPNPCRPTHCRSVSPVCRLSCRSIYLFIILKVMKRIKILVKYINLALVFMLLAITYFLIITPYRLFMSRPKSDWIEHDGKVTGTQNMW